MRKKDTCPASAAAPSRSGYPPWILKGAGQESSGQRLTSSNCKTMIIALFCGNKNYSDFLDFIRSFDFHISQQILTYFKKKSSSLGVCVCLELVKKEIGILDFLWDFVRFKMSSFDLLDLFKN